MSGRNAFFTTFLVMLILASSAVLGAASIVIKGPANNVVSEQYSQDFTYAFSEKVDIRNCTLILNGEVADSRNTLFSMVSNKFTRSLDNGKYTWNIVCIDVAGNELASPEKTLTVNVSSTGTGGYETIYNRNSLRSYVITPVEGKPAITLPAMITSEDIRIKTNKNTYYIDLVRVGPTQGTSFAEVRNRATQKLSRLMLGEHVDYDYNADNIPEVRLALKEVKRNVQAVFTVTPYPLSVSAETPETPAEEPATPEQEEPQTQTDEPAQEPVEVPEEQSDSGQSEEQASPNDSSGTATTPDTKTDNAEQVQSENKRSSGLAISILAIVIAAIAIFFLMRRKKSGSKESKPAAKKDDKPADKPSDSKSDDIDIIRSTGKKRR